jgi:hypothetical protein
MKEGNLTPMAGVGKERGKYHGGTVLGPELN